jgi:S1-C subfamily serine protease
VIPDFGYSGTGVAVGDVHAGSPAQAAGLTGGDVILAINGEAVADLRAYSDRLKQFSPGDEIELRFVRDGAEQTAQLTLTER